MRILLVEDDTSQGESIKTWLELDGYSVDWVERGDYAMTALKQHDYECILLDRGLPYASGDEILKTLRQHQAQTPVIFLTARDSISDRVEGLDLGANDYLVKPFSLEELSARIRSQMRNLQAGQSQTLIWNNICLNPKAKTVQQEGESRDLTAREFQILYKLMQHPNHVVTREQLEESIYAWGDEVESNAIEVYIYQLRKKLGSQTIRTIRGLGYRMGEA